MKTFLLSLLSAACLVLSFPPLDLEILAYIAFVPFFFAIEKKSLPHCFGIAFLTGFAFFLGLIHWLRHVTWFGMLLLVSYLALYVACFGTGVGILLKHRHHNVSFPDLLWIPALWVLLEFVRSHLLTGFGWGLLGYTQWHFLSLIQISAFTGAYGISFFVMFVNVVLYEWLRKDGKYPNRVFASFFFLVLLTGLLGYGRAALSRTYPEALRATVIQGNIPQDIKWDPALQDLVMTKYERLTEAASDEKTDLFFWPETAVPGFLPDDAALTERLTALSRKIETPLLVGAPWNAGAVTYNSALFLEKGELLERYDKLHLVPYGEFIPFEDRFPVLREWIVTGDFVPGNEVTVFEHPKGNFSVLICFEDIFPNLVRRFAKDSDFLVNITNDAWFGESGAPFQHAQASTFRAIENRRSVLRVTNTGYTCLIGPKGQLLRQLELGGKTLFVTGFRTWEVPLSKKETFYTRRGDLFVGLCAIATLPTLPLSFISRLRKK